jgi:lysophospholipase L1-like esterase
VNDLVDQFPPSDYEMRLDQLIAELHQGGAARVLVANTPPLDQLPAYLTCKPFVPTEGGCDTSRRLPPSVVIRAVDEYNAAIARVAAREGATVVDLHALVLAARQAGTESELVGPDGFHPSAAGHLLVAQAFQQALRRAWPSVGG